MKKKDLIDAFGQMEEDFVDEYTSYDVRKKWMRVIPITTLAACAVITLIVGSLLDWGNPIEPQSQNKQVVALKETDKPQPSEEPKETEIVQSSKPQQTEIVQSSKPQQTENMESAGPKHTETVHSSEPNDIDSDGVSANSQTTQNPSNRWENETNKPVATKVPWATKQPTVTKQPSVTQQPSVTKQPSTTKKPNSDSMVTAKNWNTVSKDAVPFEFEIDNLLQQMQPDEEVPDEPTYTETPAEPDDDWDNIWDNIWDDDTVMNPSSPDNNCGSAPQTKPDGDNGDSAIGDSSEDVEFEDTWCWYYFDSLEGGCFFEKKDLTYWNRSSVMYTMNEESGEIEKAIYIFQDKTTAKTLKKASYKNPNEAFPIRMEISYVKGIPVLLSKSADGKEQYARMLIEDVLITIVNQGYGEDYLMKVIENMKMMK